MPFKIMKMFDWSKEMRCLFPLSYKLGLNSLKHEIFYIFGAETFVNADSIKN